ncbi:MAG: hypothetical protein QG639_468 [Patescibacteria group bacterium]|nr:hypothetical protein [Patescibacteria group bacterium]
MPQENTKSINPLMAAVVGAAVGATAAYFMRRDAREKAVKQYKTFRSKAEKMMADTKKQIDTTKSDLQGWAQEMGDKAEEEAKKIDSRSRKVLSA